MNNTLMPDLTQANRFLDVLSAGDAFTFQTFDDSKGNKAANLARVLHGTLTQHQDQLSQMQQQGAGVFVMINKGDGFIHAGSKTCRTTKNVLRIRALWVDLDGSPLAPILKALHPDIVVESSPKRWHAYWLTNDCALEDFKLRQQQIASKFEGDPKVCDLPRVMRLPGFWHQKSQPFMTRLAPAEETK